MVKVNDLYGITSNRLWDIEYNAKTNKLLVSSLDQGVFIVDLNDLVRKSSLQLPDEILDIMEINSNIYILTPFDIYQVKDGKILNHATTQQIARFMSTTKPFLEANHSNDLLLTFRKLIDLNNHIGVTTNKGFNFLDYNLNPVKHVQNSGPGKVFALKNNDLLLSLRLPAVGTTQQGSVG